MPCPVSRMTSLLRKFRISFSNVIMLSETRSPPSTARSVCSPTVCFIKICCLTSSVNILCLLVYVCCIRYWCRPFVLNTFQFTCILESSSGIRSPVFFVSARLNAAELLYRSYDFCWSSLLIICNSVSLVRLLYLWTSAECGTTVPDM